MYSRFQLNRKGKEVPDVLLALEKAARAPNIHKVDLQQAFGWDNWSAFRTVYGRCGGEDSSATPDSDADMSIRIVDAESTARFMTSVFEVDAIVKMLTVLLEFANGLQAKFKLSHEHIASKLSKGINSLPEELLTKIFQFAVWGEGRNGGKQAVRLSHVCRSFRGIALEKPGLWTTLFSGASETQLETFISRGGPNQEYHAFLHFNPLINRHGQRLFSSICRPIIPRWKSLTLSQEYQDYYEDRASIGGVAWAMREFVEFLIKEGLQLPILEEMHIDGDDDDYYRDVPDIEDYDWASNLRVFRCSYFLPDLSPNLTSVSTFVLTQRFRGYSHPPTLKPIFDSLLAMPNLSSFDLELYDSDNTASDSERPWLLCPTITSFRLRLRNFDIFDFRFQAEDSCITILMDTLRMPSLEQVSISVGAKEMIHLKDKLKSEANSNKWSRSLFKLSSTLLPKHFSDSTKMMSLSCKLECGDYADSCLTYVPPAEMGLFNIPLERILHIRSVTVSSFVPVFFVQDPGDGGIPSSIISESCQLREFNFIECENMTSVDLEGTVDSLESLGVWKHIERVTVQGSNHLVYDEALDVIGKEKLQFLR
ncbi:hypothetical protein SCHPADRAFT_1001047 [Schizopora paradoxa]|uniref:F-box domain-containing protein n=1 Tax=Schizopora paradoxa TaxID=27342 RepID=A0A0H2RA82_9AGAM|nr:hypothetical protein SCHPADRAFT_1001047 [Schizopora paradoxa]